MQNFLFLFCLSLIWVCRPSLAGENAIARLEGLQQTMVTVHGQLYTRDDNRVTLTENLGAGVIIDPAGYIVTNTHIIYGANIIKIDVNTTRVNATVAYVSREYDFSILKISPPAPLNAISWSTTPPALNDDIVTIGHSPLLEHTLSGGKITGLGTRTLPDGGETPALLRININHYPGDSGGPVFNARGEFLGLMSSKRFTVQKQAFAIPADRIQNDYLTLVNPPQSK